MIVIEHRFNTTRSQRSGHKFHIEPCTERDAADIAGAPDLPVINNIAHSRARIAKSAREAFDIIDGHLLGAWAHWTLTQYRTFAGETAYLLRGPGDRYDVPDGWTKISHVCGRSQNGNIVISDARL